jgi:hypothetical protein
MSGLDEQIVDNEVCPECLGTPTSWRGCIRKEGSDLLYVVWMYSKEYLKKDLGAPYNQYAGEYVISTIKDDTPYINVVECSRCFAKFEESDSSHMVEKTLKLFKKAYREENLYKRIK